MDELEKLHKHLIFYRDTYKKLVNEVSNDQLYFVAMVYRGHVEAYDYVLSVIEDIRRGDRAE